MHVDHARLIMAATLIMADHPNLLTSLLLVERVHYLHSRLRSREAARHHDVSSAAGVHLLLLRADLHRNCDGLILGLVQQRHA